MNASPIPLALLVALSLIGCQTSASRVAILHKAIDLVEHLPGGQTAYFYAQADGNEALIGSMLQAYGGEGTGLDGVAARMEAMAGSIGGDPEERSLFIVSSGFYPIDFAERLLVNDDAWELQEEKYWTHLPSRFQIRFPVNNLIYAAPTGLPELTQHIEYGGTAGLPLAILREFTTHSAMFYVRKSNLDFVVWLDRHALRDGGYALSGWVRLGSIREARAFGVLLRLLFVTLSSDMGVDAQETLKTLEVERSGRRIDFDGLALPDANMRGLLQLALSIGP